MRRIVSGESLRAICDPENMPSHVTVLRLVMDDADFRRRYETAREARVEILMDEIRQIADHGQNEWMERNDPENAGYLANGESVQRSRLRIEFRKSLVTMYGRRKYGRDAKPETEEMVSPAPLRKLYAAVSAGNTALPVRPTRLGAP